MLLCFQSLVASHVGLLMRKQVPSTLPMEHAPHCIQSDCERPGQALLLAVSCSMMRKSSLLIAMSFPKEPFMDSAQQLPAQLAQFEDLSDNSPLRFSS